MTEDVERTCSVGWNATHVFPVPVRTEEETFDLPCMCGMTKVYGTWVEGGWRYDKVGPSQVVSFVLRWPDATRQLGESVS